VTVKLEAKLERYGEVSMSTWIKRNDYGCSKRSSTVTVKPEAKLKRYDEVSRPYGGGNDYCSSKRCSTGTVKLEAKLKRYDEMRSEQACERAEGTV